MSADPNHFNQLTPAEAERLALLIEECGEVIQAATKVLRHGYESTHPEGSETNRQALQREAGDLMAVVRMMLDAVDMDITGIAHARDEKLVRVRKYLHHQEPRGH